ncbi:ABC transporter permease [Rhizobium cremeum]|uniref:ABC transporter permease n=1 Tax=Rhizobium cremeum TaxID=2813827 RepID=UPI000DD931AF|nr:ABC transporter permease [Rhizobium cremeum]MCJ7997144.1 ABC transporter permease [Rhizobium cremeum]MCJ8002362.1 ABC transporter permease [Rhizobium cremeum]
MSLVSGQGSLDRQRLSVMTGLAWPFFIIVAFFGVPFLLLLRVSVARLDPAYYQGSGWSLDAMASLFQPMVLNGLTFSLWLALTVATLSMIIAFPATWFITRMSRKAQIVWLIGLLTTLALSEVLITFSWQIILSKRVGISNVAVFLGLLDRPVSLTPSFFGVVSCLIYVVIPFNVMTLYPGLSRMDSSYMEAASTMGATPMRAFFNVLLPLMRKPIATAYLTTMVMSIGAYVAPLVLGGPANWTIGVIISEVANSAQNLPQASAIAVLLMLVTGVMILIINKVGGKGYTS